ncbi:alpha-1,6-mannosylglycoprotein 6-beta-N-acetylglucosaminyltransferase B-like isoform X1 [Acipenser oxyrinchus oxyrinchus]|uniref:alpha-1,6-mannosyl-glycoprotein 6-beta-N-acetylglucosaminyltransferase n=1 Tax=Acipenser oxyrinchus oxyrinchus TaxID=40147 RepID=A0AAD8D9E1_ACIOX|nr:alpha-1,6-mannosylglycoprotein 6-beta-N-acetylglucosaminyltransferase B-like isoform X1 [Acipenser oxyrinchus oxyrinchus]
MVISFRTRRVCLVLCVLLSALTLVLQNLWIPEGSEEQLPGKPRASEALPQYGVRKLALRLETLSSQIQALKRDNIPDRLDSLAETLQLLQKDHESSMHSVQKDLAMVWEKLDTLLKRSLTGGDTPPRTPLTGMPDSEVCKIPNDPAFPLCAGKVEFLRAHWRSDPCYAHYGVDGGACSILAYLSDREDFCPSLPGRNISQGPDKTHPKEGKEEAVIRADLTPLLELIGTGRGPAVRFMQSRIERLAGRWARAGERIREKLHHKPQAQLKVLLHPGVLAGGAGERFGELAERGGPLGELVQWSDVATALFILGHKVTFSTTLPELHRVIGAPPGKGSCPIQVPLPFDLLYTDYHGLAQLQACMGLSFNQYRCRFRVLDSFGTEPAFNQGEYSRLHGYSTAWGSWELQPRQYMTMFPHSPDNSFMGFVSEELGQDLEEEIQEHKEPNVAVVYGKQDYMWQGKESYLEAISQVMKIHGTVYQETGSPPRIPGYVLNHGLLSQDQLLELLKRAKLFIGLGFPYEGPAPLEAIALGCVFLQPRFDPAHTPQNSAFYRGKPTTRQVRSQHPYAEDFIGKPYVWTVDMSNSTEVQEAVRTILHSQVRPFTPYEFTREGMLERVFAYISHQDFCSLTPQPWPPENTLLARLGSLGESCTTVCLQAALVCEPAHFQLLNKPDTFSSLGLNCSSTSVEVNHLLPAYNERAQRCSLQREGLLFSCAGSDNSHKRLCPCRRYQPGQVALCQGCL